MGELQSQRHQSLGKSEMTPHTYALLLPAACSGNCRHYNQNSLFAFTICRQDSPHIRCEISKKQTNKRFGPSTFCSRNYSCTELKMRTPPLLSFQALQNSPQQNTHWRGDSHTNINGLTANRCCSVVKVKNGN